MRMHFETFLRNCGRLDLNHLLPKNQRSLNAIFESFVQILDALAGGRRWVEKTPNNILCLNLIERFIPNSVFIHVVRDGLANTASIYDAANKYSQFRSFGGPNGVANTVAFWNRCLEISQSYVGLPNHFVIRYEDAVTNPQLVFSELFDILGLEFRDSFLKYDIEGIALPKEKWKEHQKTIALADSKFDSVFSAEQQNYVVDYIDDVEHGVPRTFW